MPTLKRLLFLISAIAILFIGWLYLHVHSSISLPAIPYEFSIRPGSNLKQVSQQLADAGVFPSKWPLILLARYLSQDSAIRAGDYQLNENISQIALLDYLTKGDAKQNEIRFLEGSTFAQMRKVLNEHSAIQSQTASLSDQEILQLIGATETAAEGLFFPDTYYFIKNSSDIKILQRAYQTMQNHLQFSWSSRA